MQIGFFWTIITNVALIAQRIEQFRPKEEMGVQFPLRALPFADMKADTRLFHLIHQHARRHALLDTAAVWTAEYAGYLMLVFVGIAAIWLDNSKLFFAPLFAGLVARFAFNEIIYVFHQRKRPVEVLALDSLVKKPKHPSFPSGHAAFFFGFAFALLAYNVPLAIACMAVAATVGLARVFCGVHWPLDIIGGMIMGVIASVIMWQLI